MGWGKGVGATSPGHGGGGDGPPLGQLGGDPEQGSQRRHFRFVVNVKKQNSAVKDRVDREKARSKNRAQNGMFGMMNWRFKST